MSVAFRTVIYFLGLEPWIITRNSKSLENLFLLCFLFFKTAPFQAPLRSFFLLPFEKRNIEISGSISENAKEACFSLHNGPDYHASTSVPFDICLNFHEYGGSSIILRHWWLRWYLHQAVNSSDWLERGQDFTMKVNFQKESAKVSFRYQILATFLYEKNKKLGY